MTQKQSAARLCLYVGQAMLAAAITGIAAVDFTDWKQKALFCLGIVAAAFNTARSYIDQTPSQIDK